LHRLSFEWLNNRLDFFHRGTLNPRAFEMASGLIRMPRRCNSFILNKLGKFSQKSASAGSDWGPMTAPRPVRDSFGLIAEERYTLRPNFFSNSANEI
jgi:hypothetical protein